MDHLSPLFQQLMMSFSNAFLYRPTVESFITITLGWILCSGRRTITGIEQQDPTPPNRMTLIRDSSHNQNGKWIDSGNFCS